MSDQGETLDDNVYPLHPSDSADEGGVLDEDSLEGLRVALEDLRHEIRARLPHGGEEPDRSGASDWLALFEELRSRVSNFGMTDRAVDIDEFGMDVQAIERARPILEFLEERYWRVELGGLEHLPEGGPCLLVANRSGLLPYDGLMLTHLLDRHGTEAVRPRFMVADWLITLPFVQPYLARLGGVRACRENTDRLLRTGRSVLAFPEGVKGAAKSFRERYQLKRFGRGGVVRAALENGVPLVPVGIVGAEEAHPVLFKSRLPARILGLPFIPVTPTFPFLGPLGALPLPSKWVVLIGEPIDLTTHAVDSASAHAPGPVDNEDLLISRSTEMLRERIQALVDEGLDRRASVWS
jgi:1-acyl-sn-glycerol-3-phosphate acyltransferase